MGKYTRPMDGVGYGPYGRKGKGSSKMFEVHFSKPKVPLLKFLRPKPCKMTRTPLMASLCNRQTSVSNNCGRFLRNYRKFVENCRHL